VEVTVSPGRAVAKGDPLFTMEAMKMEHAVVAPIDGTVQSVWVNTGKQLAEGAMAVVIEPQLDQAASPPAAKA
jgi:3-methylcrotonyl-CoA carboxylase alpha subunit